MKSPNTWFSVYPSNKKFDINNPKTDDIEIKDIARSLSMKCRFNGFANNFYSVAEHCVHIYDLICEEIYNSNPAYKKKYGRLKSSTAQNALMHDAAEAYLTDVPAPVKKTIPDFERIENNIMAVIRNKFGILTHDVDFDLIKIYDRDLCLTEGYQLGLDINQWDEYEKNGGLARLIPDFKIKCWDWQIAEFEFLDRVEKSLLLHNSKPKHSGNITYF
jgi:hypothetical protein